MEERPALPQTLDEAVSAALAAIGPTEREAIRASGDNVDAWYLGTWVRAKFGLWATDDRPIFHQQVVFTGDEDKDLALGVSEPHPDDISAEIVRRVLERLRNEK